MGFLFWRRGRESNPRMSVLQTEALPLRHHAISNLNPSYSLTVRQFSVDSFHRYQLQYQEKELDVY
jgi:hypothetical protein